MHALDAHRHRFGVDPDASIAADAGVSMPALRAYRRRHGLPSPPFVRALSMPGADVTAWVAPMHALGDLSEVIAANADRVPLRDVICDAREILTWVRHIIVIRRRALVLQPRPLTNRTPRTIRLNGALVRRLDDVRARSWIAHRADYARELLFDVERRADGEADAVKAQIRLMAEDLRGAAARLDNLIRD